MLKVLTAQQQIKARNLLAFIKICPFVITLHQTTYNKYNTILFLFQLYMKG